MNRQCSKCKKESQVLTILVNDGKTYKFCLTCLKVYDSFPGTITMNYFLKMKQDTPIYQARVDRAQGNYKWI